MNRHLPHLLSLGKGLLLAAGMIGIIVSGLSVDLAETIGLRFSNWSFLQYPVYFALVIMGSLLLVYPLMLVEDHLARTAEGVHDEAPAGHWLQGVATELLIGTLLGSMVYGTMALIPASWWLALAALWTAYCYLQPKVQAMSLTTHDEEDPRESHPDLLVELKGPLASAGLEIHDVRAIEDAEDTMMHPDLHFVKSGRKCTLFLPQPWADQWTMPELIAVSLHKVWMEKAALRNMDLILQFLTALLCLGGFAALFPLIKDRWALVAIHQTTTIPFFILWLLLSSSLIRPVSLALSRRWMCSADDAVKEWMGSPDGLMAVLERADLETPDDEEVPRWAEILFYNVPSLTQRMKRLKNPDAGC